VDRDETEHWRPSNGGVELAATLEDNLAKSGSRMLETSNAWVPGQETVAESSWEAWLAQEEGRTRGETRILYDARSPRPDGHVGPGLASRRWSTCTATATGSARRSDAPPDVRPIMERIWSPKVPAGRLEAEVPELADRGADAWVSSGGVEAARRPDGRGRPGRAGGAVLRRVEVAGRDGAGRLHDRGRARVHARGVGTGPERPGRHGRRGRGGPEVERAFDA
jgi:hypothetical protein